MDVTTETFSYNLPRILDDLANCCFVSLDFEFSGISYGITSQRTAQGPQSLQDRYSEVKSAADKFRILQIGLTICNEDVTTGRSRRCRNWAWSNCCRIIYPETV